METLDRTSKEARELARRPVGKTWVNVDALEQAIKQIGIVPWVRAYTWGGEARGVFGILEPKVWLDYLKGTDDLDGLTLAITVDEVEDLGRDAWVEGSGGRRPLDRYFLRGTIYRLRDDDLILGDLREMPTGAVPFEKVLGLPNIVRVSGLHRGPTHEGYSRSCLSSHAS